MRIVLTTLVILAFAMASSAQSTIQTNQIVTVQSDAFIYHEPDFIVEEREDIEGSRMQIESTITCDNCELQLLQAMESINYFQINVEENRTTGRYRITMPKWENRNEIIVKGVTVDIQVTHKILVPKQVVYFGEPIKDSSLSREDASF
jgi:hypothetical protein